MWLFWIISAIIFYYVKKTNPEVVRFTFRAYLKFLLWMGLVTSLRLIGLFNSGLDTSEFDYFYPADFLPLLFLSMVWWEDVIFVLPSVLLIKKNSSKMIWIPVMALSSLVFAAGHLYQGEIWAAITLFYVPLMTYFAKKNGLSTVAACHVTYDVLTFMTMAICIYLS